MSKLQSTCIIDDDSIFVYGTKRLMKEAGFTDSIFVYENGQDAINGLNQMTSEGKDLPSIIFLDLNMPVMNGWEFLDDFVKIPNRNNGKVTIYIISSSVDPRDLERIKDYKMVHNYILKPMFFEDLNSILERAV